MESKTVELRICLAILIFVLPVRSAIMSETRQAPAAGFQPMGKVTGTVMDTSGAVIVLPKPTIILEGRNSIKRVIPNDNGDYETTVPTGVYRITTEIPGFYPLRRAEFRVPPDTTVIVNLVPTPRYLVRGTTISTTESIDKPMPPPKYDEFHVPNSALSLLIQFQGKRIVKGKVKYEGAILSYDQLTIYTDELCFNAKELRANACGSRVIVEDGKQRVEVKRAMVSFKGSQPVVNVSR